MGRSVSPVGGARRPRHALEEPPRDNTTIVLIIVLILTSGFVAGTTASFNAMTRNTLTIGLGATTTTTTTTTVPQTEAPSAPTGVVGVHAGSAIDVSWTNGGTGGSPSSFDIQHMSKAPAAAGGTTDCTGTSLESTVAFAQPSSTPPYSHTGTTGHWYCYAVRANNDMGSSSYSTPSSAYQAGFVIQSVAVTMGASLDAGDTITINFNQPVDTAPGGTPVLADTTSSFSNSTHNVCYRSNVLYIGVTGKSGSNCGNDAVVGTIGGLTFDLDPIARFNTTWTWTNSNRTLTASLAAGEARTRTGGTAALTPTDPLTTTSSPTVNLCTTTSACTPTPAVS